MGEPKSRGTCFTCLGEVWDWMPYTIDNDGILQHKDPGYCIQPLKGQITALRQQLELANGFLRSAYQIALRNGECTNWEAFKKCVYEELVREHKIIYPDNNKQEPK
jgi:hypothetical protein